jgi:putative ABC transport system substrate-binding protein
MLVMPSGKETEVERVDVAKAAQALGLQLVVADATSRPEIETAFAKFAQGRADAVLVGTGALTNSHSEAIVALAARHSIPTIYSLREYVSIGGLMSYGAASPMPTAKRPSMQAASSRGSGPPTYRSCSPPSSSSSST